MESNARRKRDFLFISFPRHRKQPRTLSVHPISFGGFIAFVYLIVSGSADATRLSKNESNSASKGSDTSLPVKNLQTRVQNESVESIASYLHRLDSYTHQNSSDDDSDLPDIDYSDSYDADDELSNEDESSHSDDYVDSEGSLEDHSEYEDLDVKHHAPSKAGRKPGKQNSTSEKSRGLRFLNYSEYDEEDGGIMYKDDLSESEEESSHESPKKSKKLEESGKTKKNPKPKKPKKTPKEKRERLKKERKRTEKKLTIWNNKTSSERWQAILNKEKKIKRWKEQNNEPYVNTSMSRWEALKKRLRPEDLKPDATVLRTESEEPAEEVSGSVERSAKRSQTRTRDDDGKNRTRSRDYDDGGGRGRGSGRGGFRRDKNDRSRGDRGASDRRRGDRYRSSRFDDKRDRTRESIFRGGNRDGDSSYDRGGRYNSDRGGRYNSDRGGRYSSDRGGRYSSDRDYDDRYGGQSRRRNDRNNRYRDDGRNGPGRYGSDRGAGYRRGNSNFGGGYRRGDDRRGRYGGGDRGGRRKGGGYTWG